LGFTSEEGGEVASNQVGLKAIFEVLPTEFGPCFCFTVFGSLYRSCDKVKIRSSPKNEISYGKNNINMGHRPYNKKEKSAVGSGFELGP
jgi:hypothetical protein